MFRLRLIAAIALLAATGVCTGSEQKLPPPGFKASLVCFNNGKGGSGGNCRVTLAKIEGGLTVVTGKLTCGFPGAVSEITWTYRGQKDGKDLYHFVRRFPADSDHARTTEADVKFNGKRHILFKDSSQCIVIEPQKGQGASDTHAAPTSRPER